MSDQYQYLSLNLRRYRADTRLSQADVAAAAGIRQQYLSDLELGRRPYNRAHVAQLAGALSVTADDLLRRVRRVGCRAVA